MGNDMMEAYLYEMNTLLEQLDDIVLAAEEAKTFSQEDVNEIFRIMHTFKGSSAMMDDSGPPHRGYVLHYPGQGHGGGFGESAARTVRAGFPLH